MKKVSFDFDSTLSKATVQQYAKGLVQRGFEVWIVTSRLGFGKEPNPQWNDDVFEVAREVGIKKEHIFFTCMANKSEFLKDKDFLFHVDDDDIELDFIKSDTNVTPIYLWHNKHWIRDCEKVISKTK